MPTDKAATPMLQAAATAPRKRPPRVPGEALLNVMPPPSCAATLHQKPSRKDQPSATARKPPTHSAMMLTSIGVRRKTAKAKRSSARLVPPDSPWCLPKPIRFMSGSSGALNMFMPTHRMRKPTVLAQIKIMCSASVSPTDGDTTAAPPLTAGNAIQKVGSNSTPSTTTSAAATRHMDSSSTRGMTSTTKQVKSPAAQPAPTPSTLSCLQACWKVSVQIWLAAEMTSVTSPTAQQEIITSTSSLAILAGTGTETGSPPPSWAETAAVHPERKSHSSNSANGAPTAQATTS
mmetsp:Transcript_57579/g.134920  ORF Transcript_57579/g.134920 Transcript_57579/m.134920 type:complete len:290 (-) Transcript_57579:516-1385(-)